MEVTLVSNLSIGRQFWKNASDTPTFSSKNKLGPESMVLDPQTNSAFRSQCKVECVILIAVASSQNDQAVHFKL